MSHDATNWAIQQRGLQPATKIVLWHLCDRYHPDYGCFPTQETLASDCEMSRATVNRHIEKLEAAGLLRRVKRFDKATNRQKSTLYILGFEARFPQDVDGAVSQIDTRKPTKAVSQNEQKPCLILDESRVSNCDTNTVIGTSNRTSKGARDKNSDLDEEFEIAIWSEFPRHPNSVKSTALKAYKRLSRAERVRCIKGVGLFADRFEAENSKEPMAERLRFVCHLSTFINQRRFDDEIAKTQEEAA